MFPDLTVYITGGPNSGKSTAAALIADALTSVGVNVTVHDRDLENPEQEARLKEWAKERSTMREKSATITTAQLAQTRPMVHRGRLKALTSRKTE